MRRLQPLCSKIHGLPCTFFHVYNMNTPVGSVSDLRWNMRRTYETLPIGLFSEQEWQRAIQFATSKKETGRKQHIVPATYEVYRVKKLLTGLVFGGLDKNLGETWGMCPVLYNKAHRNTFQPDTGYTPIYPWKCTLHQRKKLDVPSLIKHVCNPRQPASRSKGSERDILQAWKLQYTNKNGKRFRRNVDAAGHVSGWTER